MGIVSLPKITFSKNLDNFFKIPNSKIRNPKYSVQLKSTGEQHNSRTLLIFSVEIQMNHTLVKPGPRLEFGPKHPQFHQGRCYFLVAVFFCALGFNCVNKTDKVQIRCKNTGRFFGKMNCMRKMFKRLRSKNKMEKMASAVQ